MQIDKELAIKILKYQDQHEDFYFPFQVIRMSISEDDSEEIEANQWRLINSVDKLEKFELRENLQNLFEETVELMAKGFIEKILNSGSVVRSFIFYTAEGLTFLPNSESDMPDVENCQVLGWGKGETAKDAFDDFIKQNHWLKGSKFKEVICSELKYEKTYNFNLKK
jgi:hypothetical protein